MIRTTEALQMPSDALKMMRKRQGHPSLNLSLDNRIGCPNTPTTSRRQAKAIQNILDDDENDDDWEDIVTKTRPPTIKTSTSGLGWYLWSTVLVFTDMLCLLAFIAALLPGFIRFAWFYAVSSNRTSVRYGTASCRQTMDVYQAAGSSGGRTQKHTRVSHLPVHDGQHCKSMSEDGEEISQDTGSTASDSANSGNDSDTTGLLGGDVDDAVDEINRRERRPVMLFFPGGAWMIGYKMWAALTARVLIQFNIVTVVADYRNRFPGICDDVTMPDMVNDVSAAIEWTIQNIEMFGGDPSRIVVVGQSAGGHLSMTALLKQAMRLYKQSTMDEDTSSSFSWKPTDLKGLIAVSAPFHFPQMRQTFRKHGLGDHVMDNMFGDCEQDDYDPLRLVQRIEQDYASIPPLPPIQVWHGAKDSTVPCYSAQEFAQTLISATKSTDIPVGFRRYEEWTHTDGVIEGPMCGENEFHRELTRAVRELSSSQSQQLDHSGDHDAVDVSDWVDHHSVLQPIWVTKTMAKVGMFCNPF